MPCKVRAKDTNQNGQSLIESCLVVGLVSLILMGLLQVSQIFAAREILYHAAARGARAKTVGFNKWMVSKSILLASIPNAGKLTTPDISLEDLTLHSAVESSSPGGLWDDVLAEANGLIPNSRQYQTESVLIPEFMSSGDWPSTAYHILDYEDWDSIHYSANSTMGSMIEVNVSQDYPLIMPMHRAFYAADSIALHGESKIENHYSLYLDEY